METGAERHTAIEVCPTCGIQYPLDTGVCPQDNAQLLRQMPDPLIGTVLPRHYRITGKLGRGAMSVVYKGLHEPLSQPVAIKLLKSHLVDDLVTFKRFQQEAKTAGALGHPNIVTIFDYGVTDQGVPYLIMELLQGESLAQRLQRQGCLPVADAIEIFTQTADALDYTHQRGIIHRDVKPSNIIIVKDDDDKDLVKIVDFGIAKMHHYEGNPSANLTATGEVFGTPLYVSPEQAMGKAIDSRADIYSLGCVMYEAIAGSPAFNGPTAFDVIRMQISNEPTPLQRVRQDLNLPPALMTAVSRSMAKRPEDRYQTMAELLHDLAQAQSQALSAAPDNAGRRTRSGLSRSTTPADSTRAFSPWGEQASADSLPVMPGKPLMPVKRPAPQAVRFRRLPWMLFALASVAGCTLGMGILAFSGKLGIGPRAAASVSKASRGNHAGSAAMQGMDAEAKAHDDKARTFYDKEDYAAAEDQCKQALAILQQKGQRLAYAVVLSDLCDIQTSAGKLDQAAEAGKKAVAMLEGTAAGQQVDLAVALETLGQVQVHRDMGEAEALYKRALALKRQALGDQDPAVADTMHALGVLNEMNGSYGAAAELLNKALRIRQSALGNNSPAVATSLRCLGSLAYKRKHYGEAEQLLKRAAAIDKQQGGTEGSGYAQDCTCLAMLYEAEKRFDQAETNYREALKISEKLYGPGSPRLVQRLRNLAQFLKTRHKTVEAQSLERTAREIQAAQS